MFVAMKWHRSHILVASLGALLFVLSPWILSLSIKSTDSLSLGSGPWGGTIYYVDATPQHGPYTLHVERLTGLGTQVSDAKGMTNAAGESFLPMMRQLGVAEAVGVEAVSSREQFLSPSLAGATDVELASWNRRVIFRGWPFLAAYYTEETPPLIGQASTLAGAFQMPGPARAFDAKYFIGHLPYRLIPLGMAGNLLFGAASGMALAWAGSALVRRRRNRRGLCEHCGYPRGPGGGPCPECGHAAPHKGAGSSGSSPEFTPAGPST